MPSQSKNINIHVALSPYTLSDDYNRHAGATLESIMANSPQPVIAHLLYDKRLSIGNEKEEEYNISCYNKIAEKYGGTVLFHHIEVPSWVEKVPALKKWGAGTLMRLYLPEILPTVDKVLYFDCDMIVNTNVADLFATDLNDFAVGACKDTVAPNFSRARRRLCKRKNIPVSNYFCAGTLLLNLKKLRDDNFTDKVLSYFKQNLDLPYLDQDLLNWYCQGNYLPLDKKYNIYISSLTPVETVNDAVLHYAASQKPWKRYVGQIDDYYWHYLLKTPWCEDMHKCVQYLRQAPDSSRAYTIFHEDFFGNLSGSYTSRVKCGITLIISIIKSILKRGFILLQLISLKFFPPKD